MQVLEKQNKRKNIGILKNIPEVISQNFNEPAHLKLGNKQWLSTCIGCVEPKCMTYEEDEIACDKLKDFPYDRDNSVCPVSAIIWDEKSCTPKIKDDICIRCGLCAQRCPIGAIYIKNNKVLISSDDNLREIVSMSEKEKQTEQIKELTQIKWVHKFTRESDSFMEELYNALQNFDGRTNTQRVLVRNLIVALGNECAISRQGDVYTRMDGVISNHEKVGALEIEYGAETLDASRNLLDDMAVMQTRYNVPVLENSALVICLSLPNKRQGYYQVIKDISKVLGVKVQTISIGALLIMCWNGVQLDLSKKDFYLDFDNLSLREAIEKILERHIGISNGFLGLMEPEK